MLLNAKRYDCAVYLCGYAIELALKARICKTLKWSGYPETQKEFDRLSSFKIHDLNILLRLTGRESIIKSKFFAEWSAVTTWTPEVRYKPIGTASDLDAKLMIESVSVLLRNL